MVIEQLPAVVVQVFGPTKLALAVLFDRLNVIVVPSGTFTNPVPGFCCTVAVNVCGVLISLVAVSGLMEIFKSTHVLVELPLSPDRPSPVVRVRLIPRTLNVVVAWMLTLPAVVEFTLIEQLPAVVVQVLGPTKAAPAVLFNRLKATVVPSGALVNPLPVFCCTVAVKVCADPTALVALGGLRVILASGFVLV